MTVTVKHSKTNAISDWTQAQLDEQIALGNFAEGTVLADIVLPSDWNNDHTLTGVGTMAEQDANSVAITGGTATLSSVTTPSVTATTNNLTLSAISTGNINLNTPNGTAFRVLPVTSASSNWLQVGNPSTTVIRLGPAGTTVADFRILAPTFTSFHTGSSADGLSDGSQQFRVANTASAVNYVQVTGAATGNRPAISSQGSDTNIGLSFDVKGGPNIFFRSYGGTNNQLKIAGTNASVNNHVISGGASTIAPSLSVEGTDTNISMAFQPKGTGAIDLAAGSSGVNISNGGTVTALTRTAGGSAYTSFPSVAISAPTTAGGVQATASVVRMFNSNATIANGGTGYTVGNVLTVVGGTPVSSAATYTVATVSAGVITSVTFTNAQAYSALPTNPVSVTGGTGSGATLNLTWALDVNGLSITNAGSGYIEQPTITFSGGGGSGASAFAFIGSAPTVKALGGAQLNIATAGGTNFAVSDSGLLNPTTYAYATGGSGSAGIGIISGNANAGFTFTSKGTSAIDFYTNNYGSLNLKVSHTASAVNYVQVSGRATGNGPQITAQGSDTNINFEIQSKGVGNVRLFTGSGEQFRVIHTAGTIVNYAGATGSATGVAPAFSVAGTDTNIDLALTPKGTGLVRFGTYVAGALTATGYINIKAADGTTYKVLVST